MSESDSELTLKQRLNLETAQISWKELELFFAKGNLLCVAKTRDLVEVAEQIVNDQQLEIENLILAKEIQFANAEWVATHCADNPTLWAVVIAPYVLCQL